MVPALALCLFWLALPAGAAADAFPADRLMTVRLWLDAKDWETLRAQPRPSSDIYCGDCLARPARHPFTTFPARLEIDGEVFDRVGVRKKGFVDSVDSERPALKIDLAHYQKGRHFRGLRRLSLSNAKRDPSLVRQCLAARLFRDADLPASRCSFVHLLVNGRDLGPYVHVETIDRHFLRRWPELFSGVLVRGTISDFRRTWLGAFLCRSRCGEAIGRRLEDITRLLEDAGPLSLDDLGKLIDLDSALDGWALESLIAHTDGYYGNANNFFLAGDREGRLRFIPWGIDDAFPFYYADSEPPHIQVGAILPHRLVRHEGVRELLLARIRRFLDTVWNEDALAVEAIRFFSLVYPVLPNERRARALAELEDVVDFICQRRSHYLSGDQIRLSNDGELQDTPCEPCKAPPGRP